MKKNCYYLKIIIRHNFRIKVKLLWQVVISENFYDENWKRDVLLFVFTLVLCSGYFHTLLFIIFFFSLHGKDRVIL